LGQGLEAALGVDSRRRELLRRQPQLPPALELFVHDPQRPGVHVARRVVGRVARGDDGHVALGDAVARERVDFFVQRRGGPELVLVAEPDRHLPPHSDVRVDRFARLVVPLPPRQHLA